MRSWKFLLAAPLALATGVAWAQELTTIQVLTPLPRHTAWYPLVVGEELGYFADEGVQVELVPGGDLPATAFLENRQVDIASLDPSEVLKANERGFDFDVVYEVMSGAVEGIFVLADSDADSADDLAGTTIGIVGESDRPLLMSALSKVGLEAGDVEIAVLGESAPLLANSLQNGDVSAVVGAVSDVVAMRSQGIDVKNILPEEMREQPANNYTMRADRIEERGEVMEGFLRAWAKGAYAGKAKPEIAAEITKKAVPENWTREELGRLLLDTGLDLHNPRDSDTYGELRPQVWERVQEELVAAGELNEAIATEEFLNDLFIAAANDFDRAEVEADMEAWRQSNM